MTQVLHADGVGNLPHNETTLPELLNKAGYYSKLIGKWHLGIERDSWPLEFGFDEFYGTPMMHGPNEGNQVQQEVSVCCTSCVLICFNFRVFFQTCS